MGGILSHTPIWVYVLFAVLVFFGVKQSKPRQVSQMMVVALPVAMLVLSLAGVLSGFGIVLLSIVFWLVGLVLSQLFNRVFKLTSYAEYDLHNQSFLIQGSWVPLMLMMAIFFTKYAVAFLQATEHALTAEPLFMLVVCAWYGLLSGSFLVRAMGIWQAKRHAIKAAKTA